MRYLLSVYAGAVFGALAGALIGFGVQQITGHEGWALLVAALGACGGAFWAGMRRAEGQPVWRVRPPVATGPPAPQDGPAGC
jgi:hypothetical protein